ncbi:MAG TPA: NADH-quinone oxidoreductase subunit L, partial [Actinoplanes sp.]|nr:NADH-quinone oxidoreductase subunit L [Actinoplanes sp.]
MEQTVEYAPASGVLSGIWLLVAIPLVSAAILLLLGKRADKWGHWLGVLSVAATFVLGLVFFISLSGLEDGERSAQQSLWDFITVGNLHVDFGLLFDPLAGVFVLLITGVGSLIHLYA